jgi:hypothetical protein
VIVRTCCRCILGIASVVGAALISAISYLVGANEYLGMANWLSNYGFDAAGKWRNFGSWLLLRRIFSSLCRYQWDSVGQADTLSLPSVSLNVL